MSFSHECHHPKIIGTTAILDSSCLHRPHKAKDQMLLPLPPTNKTDQTLSWDATYPDTNAPSYLPHATEIVERTKTTNITFSRRGQALLIQSKSINKSTRKANTNEISLALSVKW